MSIRFGATELEAAKCLWLPPTTILSTHTPQPPLSADPSLQQPQILMTVTAATTLSQPGADQLFLSTMFILFSGSWDLSIPETSQEAPEPSTRKARRGFWAGVMAGFGDLKAFFPQH